MELKGGGSRRYQRYAGPIYSQSTKGTNDECNSIGFSTDLTQTSSRILGTLIVGDLLTLLLEGTSVSAKNVNGESVGEISSIHNSVIIRCLRKGREFEGRVTFVDEETCRIHVHPKLR